MNLERAPAGALATLLLLFCSCIDFPKAKGFKCEAVSDCPGQSCAEGQCVDVAPLRADEPHYGKSMGQWAVTWATWWLTLPYDSNNPMLDVAGSNCADHQPDPTVFLLTQAFRRDIPVERTCDAVAGKPTLLPLFWWIESDPTMTELDRSKEVSDYADGVSKLTLEIDDKPFGSLRAYRIHPQRFSFTDVYDTTPPAEPPTLDGTFIDGFFVMLPPLPSGEHKLHFGNEYYDPIDDVTYPVDMTYHMVIP